MDVPVLVDLAVVGQVDAAGAAEIAAGVILALVA